MISKQYKIYAIRVLLIMGIIFWMTVIFGFSAADGEDSQSTSDMITEIIVNIMYDDYNELPESRQQQIWDNTSFLVRKTGHFGEYGVLAVLISALLLTYEFFVIRKRRLVLAVMVCVLYAVTDEIHQGFVAGRSPKVMDVCIDSAGALCGVVLCSILSLLANGLVGKKVQRDTYKCV